ncbi:MAG: 50S ribosomal protein L15 [Syntrophales bacterium]|jgi:large subunit ribosomal protein L15|nr:50S ribosomal protein L15 [Syntrophales bacterium]
MNLATLKPPAGSRKKKKRVGRGDGSGHGGTAGKGSKGQNARSGHSVRPGFEGGQMPLSRRLPKIGFKNPMRRIIATVNIDQLKRFPEGSVVDRETLLAMGLVKRKADGIKVLGNGQIDYPLSLRVDLVSRGARQKIEAAGGTILEVS